MGPILCPFTKVISSGELFHRATVDLIREPRDLLNHLMRVVRSPSAGPVLIVSIGIQHFVHEVTVEEHYSSTAQTDPKNDEPEIIPFSNAVETPSMKSRASRTRDRDLLGQI